MALSEVTLLPPILTGTLPSFPLIGQGENITMVIREDEECSLLQSPKRTASRFQKSVAERATESNLQVLSQISAHTAIDTNKISL